MKHLDQNCDLNSPLSLEQYVFSKDWKNKYTYRNPPAGELLEAELEKTYKFALIHASLLPEIEVSETRVEELGDNVYRIQVKVVNKGFQPTCLTQMAEKIRVAKPVIATLEPGEGMKLLSVRDWVDLGNIEGRAERLPGLIRPPSPGEGHAKTAEWIVKADKPSRCIIRVSSEKAGEAVKKVEI